MQKEKPVITRFAPSPTGFMHVGSVRTALFAYLFARQNRGKFILRIEDTDKERSKKEFDDAILNSMKWLGLEYDETYRQSERSAVYRKNIEKLLKEGKAFVSKEAPTTPNSPPRAGGEDRRSEVIRFKNPNKTVTFTDMIRGDISFDTTELGDFVIAKSLDEPVFHLAVAVDDYEMGITHVIRGEDHISNTPRHILIFEALGAAIPTFAHLPLVLAPDRTKLSKRKHGEIVSLEYYRKQGYLSEAIINFMALIGWNPGGDNEIFSLEELVKVFDLSKVQKGGAIFNVEKLNWFNKHYIKALSLDKKYKNLIEIIKKAQNPNERYVGLIENIKSNKSKLEIMTERIANFAELRDSIFQGEFDYFFDKPIFEKELLFWPRQGLADRLKGVEIKVLENLKGVLSRLEPVGEGDFSKEIVGNLIFPFALKNGKGDVLWPMRVALSGKEKSPDPFTLAAILGKEETLSRLKTAINLLS